MENLIMCILVISIFYNLNYYQKYKKKNNLLKEVYFDITDTGNFSYEYRKDIEKRISELITEAK